MAMLALLALEAVVRAQVPAIEELASAWTPTRFCRPLSKEPLVPCIAGAALAARACGDFGCCYSAGATPRCYEPNGGSATSGGPPVATNSSAFGADANLNDGQAVAAISQPSATLSQDWTGDLLGVECFASLSGAFVGNCKSPGGGLLLPHGSAQSSPSFGALFVGGAPSASIATGMATRWAPHALQRNATLWPPGGSGALSAATEVRTAFDERTVLLRLELAPLAPAGSSTVQLRIGLAALIASTSYADSLEAWGWDIKRPMSPSEINVTIDRKKQQSLTAHAGSAAGPAAYSAASIAPAATGASAPALTVANGYVSASWAGLVCSAATPCVVEIALAVGPDAAVASAEAAAAADDFGMAWAAARDEWQAWWAATFDRTVPSKTPWEGQLPVLVTADAALKRTYYMGVAALLGNARHIRDIAAQKDGPWDNRTIVATGGPVCAVAEMIIWDTALNSLLLSLLQPTLFASYLEKWLASNLHEHLAIDIVSNQGEQKW